MLLKQLQDNCSKMTGVCQHYDITQHGTHGTLFGGAGHLGDGGGVGEQVV